MGYVLYSNDYVMCSSFQYVCQPPDNPPGESNETTVRVWLSDHIQLPISMYMYLKPLGKMINVGIVIIVTNYNYLHFRCTLGLICAMM